MLSRLRSRLKGRQEVQTTEINYTKEHVQLAKGIARRRRLIKSFWDHLSLIRTLLALAGVVVLLALPHPALWKNTYIDEHAIQPAQVNLQYDWANVHAADRYLDRLERLLGTNATQDVRSEYLQESWIKAGLRTGNTSQSTWAHVTPPRSSGTEVILLTANWISLEGGANLRGIATLLSLGDFLRGQNHWAFDIVLVVGEGYLHGLENFMQEYYDLFPGLIWTGLNIDYPGHSFEHIGLFYEGVNGRLPNQDVINSIAHIARWAGGAQTRIHDIPDEPIPLPAPFDKLFYPHIGNYLLAAKHLLAHGRYMAFGRPSGGHGVLARHRIDSLSIYCPNATGPHGFHTLGRTIESSLRSFNNLLERLHASYFFYLLPGVGKFIPVGHYLPAAILLGASITLDGFDIPDPISGLLWLLPAFAVAAICWVFQSPLPWFLSIFIQPPEEARRSTRSIAHLLYGAIIPTLAMINFPQAILLAFVTLLLLSPYRLFRIIGLSASASVILTMGASLQSEWQVVGNLAWVGLFAVLLPLGVIPMML